MMKRSEDFNAKLSNVIIFGASGHAKVILDILEKQGQYRVIGLVDPFRQEGERFFGYKIVGNIKSATEICRTYDIDKFFIAIGDNWVRHKIYGQIMSTFPGATFITAIHPDAVIGRNVVIGNGSTVMAGSVINSDSMIGSFCIVNTCSSIDHDCCLGDFSSLAPRACLGGNVRVGKFTSISIGAVVKNGTSIGNHTVVGAGSTVLGDIPEAVVSYGTPARTIRTRPIGEHYLS